MGFFTSIFKPEGFEKHFLKIIAKYDLMIPKTESRLKRVPDGRRKDMLKDRIRKMKDHREKARQDLAECREHKGRIESYEGLRKCEYCNDGIQKSDLLIQNDKYYHSWCEQQSSREAVK